MNIPLLPKIFRDGGFGDLNPISAAAGGLQTVLGIGQTIAGAINAHKYQNQLSNLANSYKPNQSILDYYNKALAKYNPNAYNSAEYQNRANMNQRNLATGIAASQDRRGGIGAIGGLVQGADTANAQAAGQAETAQRENLSQLGTATQQKAAEDYKPFEMKYNLLAARAGGANSLESAGFQNASGGLQSINQLAMAKQIYGNGGNYQGSNNNGTYYSPNLGYGTSYMTGSIQ